MRLAKRYSFLILIILCASLNAFAQNDSTKSPASIEDFATVLVSTNSPQAREQLLSKKKELMTPDLRRALIRQGNVHLMAGRYSTAFDIYGLAQNIAEQIGDKEGIASASLDIGTVYYFQANYPAALENYRRARELFIEVTNNYESAKALSGLALIYKETRRDAEALAALQQALKEFTSLGDKEEIANTLSSIGTIYYGQGDYAAAAEAFRKSNEANHNPENVVRVADALYMQGDYAKALDYYKQSLAAAHDGIDVGILISALSGAANSAFYESNYDDALQYFQQSAKIQETRGDKSGLAISLRGIGNVHRARGDFGAALETYFKSLAISEQLKLPTGTILGSIGLVRALQGDNERALEYYRKALTEFEATGNNVEVARVQSLIGNVYYSQGNYESALASYKVGLALRVQMDDKAGQGDILAGIGSALLKQDHFQEALDSYQQALVLFNQVGNKERIADVLTRVSSALLVQGDYSKALSAAESAVSMARELDSVEVLWYALTLAGNAHRELDHTSQASQSFSDAISIVESLRARPASIEGSERNSALPYLAALDLLIDQNRAGEAFDYAERAKVQYLSELLRSTNTRTIKGLSTEEQQEERRLAGEAASYELQLDRELQLRTSSEARQSKLRDRLRETRAAYTSFRQKLYDTHPRLKIDRGELTPLKIDEIKALVSDSQTALLEYTITETNTYLFVLTADNKRSRRGEAAISLKAYPLNIRNESLATRVKQLEDLLASRSDEFGPAARDLYDILIKPAGDQLALKTKLVIVPDGALWRLAFEALQPSEDHYLIDQMQVSYAPSLSGLRDIQKLALPAPRTFTQLVGLANPELSQEFQNRVALAYTDRKLESTSQQEDEIKSISTVFGPARSQLFVGAAAGEGQAMADASRGRFLHFATPSLLDDTSPMTSFVGLASGPNNQPDGFLQAREIMNLQTSAQLVVFSDTQNKGNFGGAAALGWSWSWFVAGSPSTMLTRWQVTSPALTQLLDQFYSFERPGARVAVSKSAALRQSALTLRRSVEFHHPYYWANFALIGDAR
ncbi:MAG: hypothetical protein C5B55_00120 [Blastocatellia bacterium]|nr:MAG: hypothetical protein C5B55_00120 [Blastocatellia bacterium]